MKISDDISAVIGILQRDHGLLATYFEAADKIDWQALRKPVLMVNVEARQAWSSPIVFRRANLVRVP